MADQLPGHALVVLDEPEALALAASMPVGRIAYVREDKLFVAPVNFVLEQRDVLIRTGDGAELLEAARRKASAALEVDNIVDWSRSGWSVLIRGRLTEVTDSETVRWVLSSTLRPWTGGKRDHVVRLSGEEVTGRRIEPGPGDVSVVRT
jgi:nitroimidazol reductase NimA-like FMN-containing flavoprotein (pyridoxamine 5'-phosphate oxidase superfamily)